MSIATSLIDGVFGLLRVILQFGGTLLLLGIMLKWMENSFTRGKQKGQLGLLNPKRYWCKHRISHYTAGEHGLWAMWCADCGTRVNRK